MGGTVILLKLERMAFLFSVIVHSLDVTVLSASTNMPETLATQD